VLLVSIVWLIFASPLEKQVEKSFEKYIHNVARGDFAKIEHHPEFKTIMIDDSKIFSVCSKSTCRIQSQVLRLGHGPWKITAKISYKKGKVWKPIDSRTGCYIVRDKKFSAYIQDCDTH
jgi:hypothetical protein